MTAGAGHAGSAAENAHPERLAAIRNEEERSPSDLGTIKKTRDQWMLSTHHICALCIRGQLFSLHYFHATGHRYSPRMRSKLLGITLSGGRQPATLRKNSEDRYRHIRQLGMRPRRRPWGPLATLRHGNNGIRAAATNSALSTRALSA